MTADLAEARACAWSEICDDLLRTLGRTRQEAESEGKSADWKLAVAAAMKARSTVTNRWLSENLHLGAMHEVSRKVSQWLRQPDRRLARKLILNTNHKS